MILVDPAGPLVAAAMSHTRALWRKRCAAAAVACAFGTPQPIGQRIRVLVRAGAVVQDCDTTARWRGRLLCSEIPAPLAPEERARVHGLALRLAVPDADLEFARGPEDWVLVEARPALATPQPLTPGTRCFVATLAAWAPYRGPITAVQAPPEARVLVSRGQQVDLAAGAPLAEIVACGAQRAQALQALERAVLALDIGGPVSDACRLLAALPRLAAGLRTIRDLDDLQAEPLAVEVLEPGLATSIQDWPGRLGHWDVGVPPSGPFDDLAFRLANRQVGNPLGAPALEITLNGPRLRFLQPSIVCLAGPPRRALLDGEPLPLWKAVAVPAGSVLDLRAPPTQGCRSYLAVRHGFKVADYLGSGATFELGRFGGHACRNLQAGDLLPLARAAPASELSSCPPPLPSNARPQYPRAWQIAVVVGPQAAPDFLTTDDMQMLWGTEWRVHPNSNRTGVRLIGPKPRWARPDGGEAGLHPSNVHDNAYAFGSINMTGDTPILLGPDGPSLGGFVCPGVVPLAERWKIGQLRPNDTVRFVPIAPDEAERRRGDQLALLAQSAPALLGSERREARGEDRDAIIARRGDWCLRRAGDDHILVEVGDMVLDIGLRLRIHLLWQRLTAQRVPGIVDLTPGARSLLVHVDPAVLPLARASALLCDLVAGIGSPEGVRVPQRIVWMPMAWDDPDTRAAIARYMRTINPDAPWCPSNIEFIRRINGLDSVDEVRRIVFDAAYLVLGLGDVYLGAPAATPLDPRHRLVTTKYNPARTWTAQGTVGIGGAYMCIYGMDSPGGYQLVGRSLEIWHRWDPEPCLLRFFDIVRFYEVPYEELLRMRASDFRPRIEEGEFVWDEYRSFLEREQASIAAFRERQRAAFVAERERWRAAKKT
ncbi:MAG: 5-oxoprolinase/urea amidolyase family protein [Planctomycetota bacterium]|nr:5-oxoprolinase/urea amidolyase family protein [Planctomycetota bacterium]MCX8040005.1 5-oxoprolinase/urea amidolyase family protein [Planctomycetota bacterium]MDW8372905.1 5-oxoprolinase/urea amidolyase family protein [Planctomycetota bacterium]